MKAALYSKEHFWLAWALVNAVGWITGIRVFPAVGSLLGPFSNFLQASCLTCESRKLPSPLLRSSLERQSLAMLAVAGALLGNILGLAQGLVLRLWIPGSGA